ncbi:hypothetical protein LIA77_03168 [Sarocladium implicatum]|nr:hypothetical protein LIA77_03168 [Sarocladium implicatum]
MMYRHPPLRFPHRLEILHFLTYIAGPMPSYVEDWVASLTAHRDRGTIRVQSHCPVG